jgi:hypothetical protein
MRAREFIVVEDAETFPEPPKITAPKITAPWVTDPDDSSTEGMSLDDLKAEIEKVEKQLKHVTPVDQEVDTIGGDKIIMNISPRNLQRRNQGLPPNPEIQRLPLKPFQSINRGLQT